MTLSIWYLSFSVQFISLIIISRSIHVAADGIISFFLWLSNIPLCIYTTPLYPFLCWGILRLLPSLGYYIFIIILDLLLEVYRGVKQRVKNLHTYIYSSFTHNKTWKQPWCPSVSEWVSQLWYFQTMEHCSVLTRNEPPSQKKPGKGTINAYY